jgi:hypothetical protein
MGIMSASSHNFKFEVDLNVINHLGVGLYSSTPAALTELVANAWDADASNVWITIADDSIVIEDDGHGMDAAAIAKKFLHVGYSRRASPSANKSASGRRRVMGRKGIGKLSMFALADRVRVTSKVDGASAIAFEVDVPALRASLQAHRSFTLEEFDPEPLRSTHGTRIELSRLLKSLNKAEKYLRIKLARRFSILGQAHKFRLYIGDREVTERDREIHQHIQFLWGFDAATVSRVEALATRIAFVEREGGGGHDKCVAHMSNAVAFPDGGVGRVTGYIASVLRPSNLGSKEDSANAIAVFANGRVFSENILNEANSAKYYQNYLVGEIHADFLDEDDIDRATASREAIKKDDPRYRATLGFALSALESIGNQWDEWRTSLELDVDDDGNAAVVEWLETLKGDKRDHRMAKRLMTSIQNATVHADDEKNRKAKNVLYRGAIIGFEKLRISKQLDRLSAISDVLGPEFAAIFSTLNDVEEAAYADITKQRLEVIKKFKEIKDDPTALEKVAQTYLFNHLWLLEPSWDRVSGRAQMELTLTEHIKKVNPDSTGARLDISYRASSGRHVVVELKKPALRSLQFDDLARQARKYRQAVTQYYQEKLPSHIPPPLDIYLLVAKTPTGMDETDRKSMAEQSAKIITYDQLITDASNAYQAYLDVRTATGPLEKLLSRL